MWNSIRMEIDDYIFDTLFVILLCEKYSCLAFARSKNRPSRTLDRFTNFLSVPTDSPSVRFVFSVTKHECRLARHAFYSIFSALSRTVRFRDFQLDLECSGAHEFRACARYVADASSSLCRFLPESISPQNTNQPPRRFPGNYLTTHTYCAFTRVNELYASCFIRERRPGRVGTRIGRMRLPSWKGHVGGVCWAGFGGRDGNSSG